MTAGGLYGQRRQRVAEHSVSSVPAAHTGGSFDPGRVPVYDKQGPAGPPGFSDDRRHDDGSNRHIGGGAALTSRRGGGSGEDRTSREPKSINEHYKTTDLTLLRFCNVSTAEAVAPIWRRLAKCTKSEYQHTIMVQEFQRVCMARRSSPEFYVAVVTSGLKQMIVDLQFVGHGIDDLSSGCQPFMVVFSGSTNHRRQALEAANVGNQLAQGDQSASLADYVTLRAGEKIEFPRDIMKVGITIGRYAVLCQSLYQGTGPDNPVVSLL